MYLSWDCLDNLQNLVRDCQPLFAKNLTPLESLNHFFLLLTRTKKTFSLETLLPYSKSLHNPQLINSTPMLSIHSRLNSKNINFISWQFLVLVLWSRSALYLTPSQWPQNLSHSLCHRKSNFQNKWTGKSRPLYLLYF